MFLLAFDYYSSEDRKKRHLGFSLSPLIQTPRSLRDLSSRITWDEMTSEINSTKSEPGCNLQIPELSRDFNKLAAGWGFAG